MKWDLENELDQLRQEFPILSKCVYLLSNSLGAVPKKTKDDLLRFYHMWSEYGAGAWDREWWELAQKVGDELSGLLGAEKDSISMQSSATHSHWMVLSTQFHNQSRRNKIIMTDLEFPSVIYALNQIAAFMGWKIDQIESRDGVSIEPTQIIDRIDDKTLFVATSHVCFKSAFLQDIQQISNKARERGAYTLIDGFHAPGTVPVNLKELGVDFYVGGCLKWLCGGPGNAFLYVRPDLSKKVVPMLTGWAAHKHPFQFDLNMEYTSGAYRFLSGTPSIPSLYTASSGLKFIKEVGVSQIRQKSLKQTSRIIEQAKQHGFSIHTPEKDENRAGAVSISCSNAHEWHENLEKRGFVFDFRKGQNQNPDVLRIAPHFYTKDEELDQLFKAWSDLL